MICAGCGLELPHGTGSRGRPARFHNGTCRQRAHRARTARQGVEALAALDAIEEVVSELRRAILAGQRPSPDASGRLARVANNLAGRLGEPVQVATPAEPVVTELVTLPGASSALPHDSSAARESDEPAAGRPRPLRVAVTENVTESSDIRARVTSARRPPRSTRSAPLDLDTVRLERSADPGVWRVLAGDRERPTLVGFLEPTFSIGGVKRWLPRTEHRTSVTDRPLATRKAALLRLLGHYKRAAGRQRRPREA
ncbi:hypothetical protein BKA01_008434 [Pseudonocardia eucalypti]|nr:hypothetical protein [Pseudonocardia eucalypti]